MTLPNTITALPIRRDLFRPGQRVAVAVSGGADSVALLRTLHALREPLGLVLSVIHVHHGIRGPEADADLEFVTEFGEQLALPIRVERADVPRRATENGETIEEAARTVRYALFGSLLDSGGADLVATAHTLDDQAETVMIKMLRGAWTEGLGGIHPILKCGRGAVVRPFLEVSRAAVETYLTQIGQTWREDASNADLAFTRNRVRHRLLPVLREFNPQIGTQLARMAAVARDEEAWWEAELARVVPSLLLPGKPVRGGGRATSTDPTETSWALEIERLGPLPSAMRRRVLRAAAERLGLSLGFDHVESLLALCGLGQQHSGQETEALRAEGRRPRMLKLPGGVVAERTPRELRLTRAGKDEPPAELPVYELTVPGELCAPEYGLMLAAGLTGNSAPTHPTLLLRTWRPGDRVTLRHSRGPKKVKEVLERMHVTGAERAAWPVVVCEGAVVWMRGAAVDSDSVLAGGIAVKVCELPADKE